MTLIQNKRKLTLLEIQEAIKTKAAILRKAITEEIREQIEFSTLLTQSSLTLPPDEWQAIRGKIDERCHPLISVRDIMESTDTWRTFYDQLRQEPVLSEPQAA